MIYLVIFKYMSSSFSFSFKKYNKLNYSSFKIIFVIINKTFISQNAKKKQISHIDRDLVRKKYEIEIERKV